MSYTNYSREDILKMALEDDIEFIRMQFTDIFGQLKNVAITRSQLEKAVNNQITIDGSSIEGFARIYESDQYLYPDLNSWAVIPWRPQHRKVARLICDVYNSDGSVFAGDPRNILKNELAKAQALGYEFNVGPECEFFLFETDDCGNPTTKTADEAGYFDLAPIDRGSDTRREICLTLEKLGYEIEASHHEVAHGQHEIDFRYGEALDIADKIMTFKLAVKVISQRNGLHATFMPKPLCGVNGSGMHINMSLFKDGKNIFCDENDPRGLSREAYCFIAGILEHVNGFTALTNPLVNSYKRLVPGYEAPCYLAWSSSSRSTLIRIPSARGTGTRIELRCPDPCANPYLALAACLAAGLDGIKRGLLPPEEVTENISALTEKEREDSGITALPGNLSEALGELKRDTLIRGMLGEHIYSQYYNGKMKEWNDYRTSVSEWELARYMKNY